MIINIRATNRNGDTFEFNEECRIVNGLDLSGLGADVYRTQNSLGGSTYQATRIQERSGDLLFHLFKNGDPEETLDLKRGRLYTVFNPMFNPIRLNFTDTLGKEFYLDIQLLASPFMRPDKSNDNNSYQVGLIQYVCSDPFIYEETQNRLELAAWIPNFKFDLEIPDPGIELEYREQSRVGTINYTGSTESGVLIRFKANGEVVNPALVNVNTFERVRVNYTMQSGDIIEINTERGNRTVRLTRGGITRNIFNAYDIINSTFITLKPGDNVFSYEASSGLEFLEVNVDYRIKRVGL